MVSVVWPLLVFFLALFSLCLALDTINGGAMSIRNGDTLESSGGSFRLGFFTPTGSTNRYRYLGIWFNKDQAQTIVWVANRENPLNDSAGVFRLGADCKLVVLDGTGTPVWSSKASADEAGSNPVAQLLESGNLVVRDDSGRHIWQSFDEPGDTLLPGMRLRLNLTSRANVHLTSWKSAGDPSPGNYTYKLHGDKLPHSVIMDGSAIRISTGPLVGRGFSGFPEMNANGIFNSTVAYDGDEVYYEDKMIQNSSLVRFVLSPAGVVEYLLWTESGRTWETLFFAPTDVCDRFANCGPYAACRVGDFPACRCLSGFEPRSPREWFMGNGTLGCVRRTKLECGGGDGFVAVPRVKLPDGSNTTVNLNMSLDECRVMCRQDCSCTAYASAGAGEGGGGCIHWFGDLVDMRNFTTAGQDLYLHVAAADLEPTASENQKRSKSRRSALMASAIVLAVVVLLVLCGCSVRRKWNNKKTVGKGYIGSRKHLNEANIGEEDLELPLFGFEAIASATNNFSIGNKLGEGGFGVVYKGTLEDGREVAVKRLSGTSVQGLSEFMNEVMLIAKLQHKNLVRLLGCCIQGEERMLMYEYMKNRSLDAFIFEPDDTKRASLSWRTRFDIISGIARGLLYLHQDSRVTIIHRDLKAGNILLDDAMNPKISDFGTARIFAADQSVESTRRVIGTYGYMSPEYALNGIISIKSDVFSFGVIILEIISGIRNRGIYDDEHHLNLLAHAWRLWQEGNYWELIDATIISSCPETEAMIRCIQVGLLCVQERAIDRPTMPSVVMMLGSETFPMPQPKKPGFLMLKSPDMTEISSSGCKGKSCSTNEMTITSIFEGR